MYEAVMRRARTVGALLAATAVLGCAGTAAAQSELAPNFPWPSLLPPQEVPNTVQPGPVSYCQQASIKCVDETISRMRALRRRLGCDHRAIFATTYLLLTEEIRKTVVNEPHFYRDNEWLIYLDVLFAKYYFDTTANYEAHRRVPDAWGIGFETAAHGDANAGQDMLLGINAHVQRDMPYVMSEVGLRMRDGSSRKPDHDAANEILRRGYDKIVETIANEYDPLISTTNSEATPVDNMGGLELVKEWREGVWRNAERLLNAKSAEERASISQQIEDDAAVWARSFASNDQPPGYRAYRDAYCRARLRFADQANVPRGRVMLVSVRPRRVRSGRRVRYRFRVFTRGPGKTRAKAVKGARVRFAGRWVRTGRRGRVARVARLKRRGLRFALARKRGVGTAYAAVRVVRRR
jgi:hypothetical protein